MIAISAGMSHSLALKSDGTVVAWGNDDKGRTDVPVSAAGASAIAAAWSFGLALVPQTVPGAPSGVVATPSDGAASVAWTAPASDGHSPITGYTVTSSPDGKTCSTTGARSCVVSGLANGTPYTFTVKATNAIGTGPASAPSAAVTPTSGAPAPTETASAAPSVAASQGPSSSPTASVGPGSTSPAGGDNTPLIVALIVVGGVAIVALILGAVLGAMLLRQRRVARPAAEKSGPPRDEKPRDDTPPGGGAS